MTKPATAKAAVVAGKPDPAWAATQPRQRREAAAEFQIKAIEELQFWLSEYRQKKDWRDKARAWDQIVSLHWIVREAHRTAARIAGRFKENRNRSFPSYELLMAETGRGKSTIRDDVHSLESEGFLRVRYGTGKGNANEYSLCLPQDIDAQVEERVRKYAPFGSEYDEAKGTKFDAKGREKLQQRARKTAPQSLQVTPPIEGISPKGNASSINEVENRDRAPDAHDAVRPDDDGDPYRSLANIASHLKAIKRALDFNINRSDAEGLLRTLPRGEAIDRAYDAAHEHETNSESRDQVQRLLSSVGFLIDRFSDEPWQTLCRALGHKIEGDDD